MGVVLGAVKWECGVRQSIQNSLWLVTNFGFVAIKQATHIVLNKSVNIPIKILSFTSGLFFVSCS